MGTFATSGDLVAFLDDDGLDLATADVVLRAVSDEIRDAVGWSVTQETGVIAVLDGPGRHLPAAVNAQLPPPEPGESELLLPTKHLTAVAAVVEDGKTLATPADYLWYPNGKLVRVSGGSDIPWTGTRQGVRATFTHGYPDDGVPGVFKMVTLETAARLVSNPGGTLKSRTVGRIAVTYADARAAVGAIEDPRLDYYRLPEGF